jgi:hypothetical protein
MKRSVLAALATMIAARIAWHDEPTEAEDVDIRHIKPRLRSFVGRNANRFTHGIVAHGRADQAERFGASGHG